MINGYIKIQISYGLSFQIATNTKINCMGCMERIIMISCKLDVVVNQYRLKWELFNIIWL
jgi:hypothetical protein